MLDKKEKQEEKENQKMQEQIGKNARIVLEIIAKTQKNKSKEDGDERE